MNLLLFKEEDVLSDGSVRLLGRQARHAHDVLKVGPGDQIRVGKMGGLRGHAQVLASTPTELHLQPQLTEPPPPRAAVDLILALPRPKALKKVLPAVASLGVNRLVLLNAFRVEKSYFDSDVLEPETLESFVIQGLEQAQDTRLPHVEIRKRFRPFVEDELPHFAPRRLVAHPTAATSTQRLETNEHVVLAIGPEGGWIPFEVELLAKQGFVPFSLGPRILRVETVVPFVLGQIAALRASF